MKKNPQSEEKVFFFVVFARVSSRIIQTFVLCSTLIRIFPSPLGRNAAPLVTFTEHFIPSNQPHLAIHLALSSLAELPDCAEPPASLFVWFRSFVQPGTHRIRRPSRLTDVSHWNRRAFTFFTWRASKQSTVDVCCVSTVGGKLNPKSTVRTH